MRLRRDLVSSAAVCVAASAIVAACEPYEATLPLDRAVFPTGLAVAGDRLLVVSSDFDLRFADGALLSADLDLVREALDAAGGADAVVEDAFTEAALVPPFGDRPTVTTGGERVYVPTRGVNRVAVLDVDEDGSLSCGAAESTPRCGESPFALQLRASDPFDVILTEELRGDDDALVRTEGMVTTLSSDEVTFFVDNRSEEGAQQVQITGTLKLGDTIRGVRSMVLRPPVAGTEPVVIAAAEFSVSNTTAGAILLLFQPDRDTDLASFDVTVATGAVSMRDIVLVPGEDGDADAIVAVLRGPDALARFEIDDGGELPSLRLSAVAPTCRTPTSLAYVRVPAPGTVEGAVDRVLLTCQDGDVVQAIDPRTLRSTDAVRFFGRGPYDVAVDASVSPPEAFVSFFLDGSVGVLRFVDEGGLPRLVARGRIGAQQERPEDGRE